MGEGAERKDQNLAFERIILKFELVFYIAGDCLRWPLRHARPIVKIRSPIELCKCAGWTVGTVVAVLHCTPLQSIGQSTIVLSATCRCIHLYTCILAFSENRQLLEENKLSVLQSRTKRVYTPSNNSLSGEFV